MHHDRSNRPAPRVGRPIRRATSFVAVLAFTACTGIAAQTIDRRMTAGDFELTDSVNRFALQKDLDFAPLAVQKGRTPQMLATLAALEAVRSFDPNAVPVVASAR